ncbi:MAG: GntR family transcriptional regulator [Ignavibacteria bacterium]|jgi:DNA-binding transcriptional regulator YhcF (GntR family)|nr:GntR family transcriptional regulator [Ignavibacteria bacterium]
MEYKTDKPIYMQIADHICDQILYANWVEEERIPSVRELSAQMGVNPNTTVRTFETLERENIIYSKRGIGYFVAPNAIEKVKAIYKKEFFESTLPSILNRMSMLGISMEELTFFVK